MGQFAGVDDEVVVDIELNQIEGYDQHDRSEQAHQVLGPIRRGACIFRRKLMEIAEVDPDKSPADAKDDAENGAPRLLAKYHSKSIQIDTSLVIAHGFLSLKAPAIRISRIMRSG